MRAETPGAEEPVLSRINDAFPRLACLSIIGAHLRPWSNALALPDSKVVTFKSLEILAISAVIPHEGFLAPLLRHLWLEVYSGADSAMWQRFPLLESMLIRHLLRGVNLSSLPHLRIFGFPAVTPSGALRPDRFPSLTHLWLYAGTTEDTRVVKLVEEMPENMPKVSQITVDLSLTPATISLVGDRSRLAHRLMKCAVVCSGMFTARKGLFGDSHVILEKLLMAI